MTERHFFMDDTMAVLVRVPDDEKSRELAEWWVGLTEQDISATLPKVQEYSAHDLRLTGQLFEFLLGQPEDPPVGWAEMTCWFYLTSKVMRAIGALKDGVSPSDDTLRDIRIYATMITRVRATGGWPGVMQP